MRRKVRPLLALAAAFMFSTAAFSQKIDVESPSESVVKPGTLCSVTFRVFDSSGKISSELPTVDVLEGDDLARVLVDSRTSAVVIYGQKVETQPKKPFIRIRLTAGNSAAMITMPYTMEADPKPTPVAASKLVVEPVQLNEALTPGKSSIIAIAARDTKDEGVKNQVVELAVAETENLNFVGITSDGAKTDDKGIKKFEVFLKALPSGKKYPDSVYLIAKSGNSLAVPFRVQLAPSPSHRSLESDFYVMSDDEAKRVFGRSVAKEYYAILASVKNKTEDEYQITYVGFEKRPAPGADPKSTFATAPYAAVRASQERRNLVSVRGFLLTGIAAFGNLMTGFTPFFHNVTRRDHFTTFTNILTVPGYNAVNSVFPDTVPLQLRNLEALGLRGDTILDRSRFEKYVFISKKAITLPEKPTPVLIKETLGSLVVEGVKVTRGSSPGRLNTPE